MNFESVTSKDNPLIKLISQLQTSAKKRRENGLFVIEGLRICKDAYDNGIRFDKLIISESANSKYKNDIEIFSKNAKKCYKIPDTLFKKITDTETPQGIIALAKFVSVRTCEIKENGKYIALENLSEPANLGAVARTAEAFGVDGIILSDTGCDPYSPKSLRASMGTLLRMPVIIKEDFCEFIKNTSLKTFACVVDKSATSIEKFDLSGGCIMIVGNEANGLTDETKMAADSQITIPMKGKAESLNAAVASSIAIWEMMKK